VTRGAILAATNLAECFLQPLNGVIATLSLQTRIQRTSETKPSSVLQRCSTGSAIYAGCRCRTFIVIGFLHSGLGPGTQVQIGGALRLLLAAIPRLQARRYPRA
jgi:hypothetical protein